MQLSDSKQSLKHSKQSLKQKHRLDTDWQRRQKICEIETKKFLHLHKSVKFLEI